MPLRFVDSMERTDAQKDGARWVEFQQKGEEIAKPGTSLRRETMVKEMEWKDILKLLQKDKKKGIARKEEHYVNRSLFCLPSSNFIRAIMIQTTELQIFNTFILICILLNCLFLVLDQPICGCHNPMGCSTREIYRQMLFTNGFSTTGYCSNWTDTDNLLSASEIFFTIVFAAECVIKILAKGFILHKHAYLRDPWNWLDFIVVLGGVLSFLVVYLGDGSGPIMQLLRVLRVLRPLRTMTRIKGMKPLLNTLYRAILELPEILVILAVFLILFGVTGMQFFSGSLRGRCFVNPQQNFTVAAKARLISQQIPFMDMSTVSVSSWQAEESMCSTNSQCSDAIVDGRQYVTLCTKKKWCHDKWCENDWNDNPHVGGGMFSFDNFPQSILVLFQVITLEGWADFLYAFEDASYDNRWLPNIFFHLVIIFGAFFVLQLLLAVLTDQYAKAQHDAALEKEKEAMDEKAILKSHKGENEKKRDDLKQFIHDMYLWIGRKLHRSNEKRNSTMSSGLPKEEPSAEADSAEADIDPNCAQADMNTTGSCIGGIRSKWMDDIWKRIQQNSEIIIRSVAFESVMMVMIVASTACMGIYHHSQFYYEANICRRRCDIDASLPANASQHCHGPLYNRTWDADPDLFGSGTRLPQRAFCFLNNDNIVFPQLAKDQTCAQHTDRTSCESAVGRNGLGCYFFGEGEEQSWEWTYAITPGCKMGLYDPDTFASNAAFWNGARVKLGLREICGDILGSDCSSFAPETENALETANIILCIAFVIEAVLKMFGLGVINYFSDSMNKFDFFVVCISITDVVVGAIDTDTAGAQLATLRAVRLFRLFKLARSWKDMRRILTCLGQAFASLAYNVILLALFMYIFALLAMMVFGGVQHDIGFRFVKTDAPRQNFDTFFPSIHGNGALFSVFQIITAENWNTIMYDMLKTGPAIYAIIPMVIVFGGNFIIMNVFIAILLSQFMNVHEDDNNSAKISFISSCMRWLSGKQAFENEKGRAGKLVMFLDKLMGTRLSRVKDAGIKMHTRESHFETRSLVDELMRTCKHPGILISRIPYIEGQNMLDHEEIEELPDTNEIKVPVFGFAGKSVVLPDHNSFGYFKPMNPMRRLIAYIVRHPIFDNMILTCIFITTILLLVERPEDPMIVAQCPITQPIFRGQLQGERLDCSVVETSYPGHTGNINCPRSPDSPMFGKVYETCDSNYRDKVPSCCETMQKLTIMQRMDKIFAIVFLAEMLMRMISEGVIFHELSYFFDPWNILDFVVVVSSLLTAFVNDNSQLLKALRLVRALRPLRVVKRIPSLKVAATCLLASIPAMVNVFVVVLVWYSMLAMIGVQYFRGGFYYCYSVRDEIFYGTAFPPLSTIYAPTLPLAGPESVPSIIECVSQGRMVEGNSLVSNGLWTPKSNTGSFDNALSGLLTLIATSTTEGWTDMLTACSDVVGPGITPLPQYQSGIGSLLSIIHVFLGSFVLWNVVAAEVIANYMEIKDEQDGLPPMMTKEQHDWQFIVRLIVHLKPREQNHGSNSSIRLFFCALINHPWFSRTVNTIICINMFVMMANQHDDSDCTLTNFFWLDVFFASFFLLEAILNLVALGASWYFSNVWNIFDFIVVASSIFSATIDYLSGYHSCPIQAPQAQSQYFQDIGQIVGFFKIIRVLRILRLLRLLKGVRRMLDSLITSLPSLASVASLLLLLMGIFAVLSANLFSNVSSGRELLRNGFGGSESHNYQNFYNSFRMLFRFLTGEAWPSTMSDAMQV
jgi:hypothetical protein